MKNTLRVTALLVFSVALFFVGMILKLTGHGGGWLIDNVSADTPASSIDPGPSSSDNGADGGCCGGP